jgi:hypothetical protein
MSKFKQPLVIGAAVSSLALAGIAPAALARHGADDSAAHRAADHHRGKVTMKAHAVRHRADDDRGGHGSDEGPGHR